MSKAILVILSIVFSTNLVYAATDFNIDEHIEDMNRTSSRWNKTRLQIISSSQLSHEELDFFASLKQDRRAATGSIVKNLLRGPYIGNFNTTVYELGKIDQHYANYLKHNLPKDLYGELASKCTAFKISNGEKLEIALKNDFEI